MRPFLRQLMRALSLFVDKDYSMLEFILRNKDAIILGFIFLLLGGAVSPLFAALFRKNSQEQKESPKTFTQIVEIDNSQEINNYYNRADDRRHLDERGQPDDIMIMMYCVVAICFFGYLYWRQEILLTLTSISLFSIGLFIGAAIYAYIKDAIDGAGWTAYLIFTLGVAGFSFILIASALKPEYAPDGLDAFQMIFRQQKFAGIIRALDIESFTWLVTHVAGVFILFYIQIRLSLSLGHYLSIVNLNTAIRPQRLSVWVARRTKKYKNPLWNGFVLSFLCFVSHVLINGYGYVWYRQLFI